MTLLAESRFSLSPDLHPGYHLRRLRGVGGYGEVWEADKDGGGVVALKFLPGMRYGGGRQELRSIQIVQKLSHPNLIQIERVWCAGGFLVIAMELADGSLADLLEVYRTELGTALPLDHLLPLLTQAAEALDFLNNRHHLIQGQSTTVQHCDINPTNLLVFGQTVKVSDFTLTSTLTTQHKIHRRAGTPAYAAPEVFHGRLSDRTDQYSLAMCYCQLRGGRLPFVNGPTSFPDGYTRPAPDLSMLTEAEQPILARALAVKPQDRWSSCAELLAKLQELSPSHIKSRMPSRLRRTRA
jgi:serine/threonine protein kinase